MGIDTYFLTLYNGDRKLTKYIFNGNRRSGSKTKKGVQRERRVGESFVRNRLESGPLRARWKESSFWRNIGVNYENCDSNLEKNRWHSGNNRPCILGYKGGFV